MIGTGTYKTYSTLGGALSVIQMLNTQLFINIFLMAHILHIYLGIPKVYTPLFLDIFLKVHNQCIYLCIVMGHIQ